MKNIEQLFIEQPEFKQKPWLIIGKGPSYQHLENLDLSAYHVLTLNHVITAQKAKISHLIDLDVFENCSIEIDKNADYLIMPFYPHVNNQPSRLSLKKLIKKLPLLQKLDNENRLYWYDHLGIKALLRHGLCPKSLHRQIRVSAFSAEAAVDILSSYGIKDISTIGVDGGVNYHSSFDKTNTLLSNGQTSFDNQFENIIKVITQRKVNFKEIGKNTYPIKVYIATQEEQMLAVKVLEYSINKHTSHAVEIFPLHLSNMQYRKPKDKCNQQRTPFSFQRFLIPQLNHGVGRAIYLDSDMQVFSDINLLWTLPMGSHDVLTVIPSKRDKRRLQFSVMLMDCEKLNWHIESIIDQLDSGELTYEKLMYDMGVAKNIGVCVPQEWNCLEWFNQEQSLLVHYTDMPLQPWVSRDNKLGHLWVNDLIEAVDKGIISLDYIKEHIAQSWVRPSLLYQVEQRIPSSLNLPKNICQLDDNFIAPFKKL
ncbi:MAG: glycosyltransferase [Methylococcaceae bacterium]